MNKRISPKPTLRWVRPVIVTLLCIGLFFGYYALGGIVSKTHDVTDLVFDDQGNFYLSDSVIAQIQKINLKGDQVASIGTQGQSDGQFHRFYSPNMVTVDHLGNIYAAGYDDTYIQKFDKQGNFVSKLDIGRRPHRLITDSQNNLLVFLQDKPFVVRYDKAGRLLADRNGFEEISSHIDQSTQLTFDHQGNLYLMAAGLIYKYDPQGQLMSKWPLKSDLDYGNLAVDNQGYIYLAGSTTIQKYSPQGQFLTSWAEPQKPYKYIWRLAVDPAGQTYVLSRGPGQAFVQRLDANLHPQATWSFGFPSWLFTVFISCSWLWGLLLAVIVRWAWSMKLEVAPTDTEPLPAWVETGKVNPRLLYDHLDLAKLPTTRDAARRKDNDKGLTWAIGTAALAGGLIFIIEFLPLSGDDKLSFGWPVFALLGMLLVSGFFVWQRGLIVLKRLEVKKKEQQALIRQVQGTLRQGSGSIFISRGGRPWPNPDWSFMLVYPAIYMPMTLAMLYTYNLGGDDGWFQDWPGWLIEMTTVVGLVGVGLLVIWLLNWLQSEKSGNIRLNRTEMLNLQGWSWLWLFGFVVLTVGLNGLILGATHTKQSTEQSFESSDWGWQAIFAIVRYGFLILGFFYLQQRWLNAPYEAGNYEAARRRIVYWRRWSKTLNARLRHAEILRRAGRLNEAEYVLQETLAKPNFQTPEGLAKILAALGLVRLDQERYAEAMFVLENSLLLNSSNSVNSNNLAEVYLWLNHRPDRALTLSNRILPSSTITGKSVAITDRLINLAWAQAQLGRWPEAEANLAEAFKKVPPRDKPFRASLLLRAGIIMQLKGDYQAAMDNYGQATALDPNGYNGQKAAEYLAYNQAALPVVPQSTL